MYLEISEGCYMLKICLHGNLHCSSLIQKSFFSVNAFWLKVHCIAYDQSTSC